MTEYIEREKVLKTLEEIKTEKEKEFEKRTIFIEGLTTVFNELCAIKSVIEIIKKDIPAADVVPVVNAKWIPKFVSKRGLSDFFVCSECNEPSFTPHKFKMCPYNYCHNCGARMDGDNHVKEN